MVGGANRGSVAPPVGAWIETPDERGDEAGHESRPPWARGLKRYKVVENKAVERRAPRGRVD